MITAELPESVLQTVEFVRQRRVRDEWRARKARGEIPASATTSTWTLALARMGEAAHGWRSGGAAFGSLVQVIAGVLGALVRFRPGPVGLLAGILGAAVACFALQSWQDVPDKPTWSCWRLTSGRSPVGRTSQMIEAHKAAVAVIDLWPHLPVREEPALPQLRKALWFLAEKLPDRQQLAATLGNSGVPP